MADAFPNQLQTSPVGSVPPHPLARFLVKSLRAVALGLLLTTAQSAFAISVGQQVRIANTCGTTLKLRSGEGITFSVIGENDQGDLLQVIGGGTTITSDGFRWWRVRDDQNREGYSAVAEWLNPFPSIGISVTVTSDGAGLRLRTAAGVSNPTVGSPMPAGTSLSVIGGPVCADAGTNIGSNLWWQLSGAPGTGWATDGHWLIATCGDGTREGSEQCDGSPMGCSAGQTCTSSCTCQGGGDSDGDGVPDASDACPGTASGAVVDGAGCSCAQKACDDGNLCTNDSCDPGTAQCATANNSNSCTDGNPCTVGDICSGGSCSPGALTNCYWDGVINCGEQCDPNASPSGCGSGQTCSSSCACVSTGCTSNSQCTELADQCNNGVCNLSTGVCERQPKSTGTLCNDGDPCTIGDQCSAGTCLGGPSCGNGTIEAGCSEQCDGSPTGCQTGQVCSGSCTCIGGSGSCSNDPQCEDGNACTIHACVGGSCRHLGLVGAGTEGPPGNPSCSNGIDDDCNGFGDSAGLPTGQAPDPRCTGLEFVDPFRGKSIITSDGSLTTDTSLLATGGQTIGTPALASDGVARLFLRVPVPGPGTVTFDISNLSPLDTPETSGFFASRSETEFIPPSSFTLLQVSVERASGRYFAYAQFVAPSFFRRASIDDDDLSRTRTIRARFVPANPGTALEYTASVYLVRPPVVLVHGLWGQPNNWESLLNDFFPSAGAAPTDPCRLPDLDAPTPSPWFICAADYADIANQKLFLAATRLAKALDETIKRYRSYQMVRGRHLVISRADVVGHSMGGLVARTLAMCEDLPGLFADCAQDPYMMAHPYRRIENFFKGGVRRLISIGTPHYGSPLAARLRDALATNLACFSATCPPGYAGLLCPIPERQPLQLAALMTRLHMSPGPALGDLSGELAALDDSLGWQDTLSGALFALATASHYGVCTHAIGGDSSDVVDWGCGTVGVFGLKTFCPGIWTGATIDSLLGPSHDLVVPLRSQLADRSDGASASVRSFLVHSNAVASRCPSRSPAEPDAPSVWARVRTLLDAPPTEFGRLPATVATYDCNGG